MLKQNQESLRLMARQQAEAAARRTPADPLSAIVGPAARSADSSVGSGSALRGMAARDAWAHMTQSEGPRLRAKVRERLAAARRIEPRTLQPGAMRTYFERGAPLGNQRQLTYFSMVISAMWEALERSDSGRVEGLVALAAGDVEQCANGSG